MKHPAAPLAWPCGEGEMARRIRAHDWTSTPLGPCESWPSCVTTALQLMLDTPQVASLAVGPQQILLYNDRAAAQYGSRHPAALGRPIAETFADQYPRIAGDYARVFAGESVHVAAQPVDSASAGAPEVHDAYLTPVRDGDGAVIAAYCTFVAAGERIRAEAALRESEQPQAFLLEAALRESEARYRSLFESMDEAYAVVEVLKNAAGEWYDFRFIEVNPAFLEHTSMPWPVGRTATDILGTPNPNWTQLYGRALDTDTLIRVEEDEPTLGRTFDLSIFTLDRERNRVAVLFTDITERKRMETALRESKERNAFLLKLSDALRPFADPVAAQEVAMKLLVEHFGLVRAACYEVDEDQNRMKLVVSVETDAVHWPATMLMSDYAPDIAQTYQAGQSYAIDDSENDSRLSAAGRAAIQAFGIRSLAGVPLVKDGKLRIVMGVHARQPREWKGRELRLLEEVAERIWSHAEHARAEAALRESEVRFRAIVEQAVDYAIFTMDAQRRIDSWHPGAAAVFGWSAEEAIGRDAAMLWTPEDRAAGEFEKEFTEALETGVSPDVRWHLRKDGSRVFIDGVARGWRGPAGEARVLKIGRDMSERQRTAEALRESEERFRQFSDASTSVLWIRNADTLQMTFASPAFDTIYGIPGPDRGGDGCLRAWARLITRQSRKAVLANFRRVRAGERVEQEFQIRRASDGALRWIHDTDFPLRDASGRVRWLAGLGADITDAKEAANRQQVMVAELQHRTRNLMGVVRSVADKTARASTDLADFRARFRDRLEALSRVQGLLSRLNDVDRVNFDDLIQTELAAMDGDAERVTLDGPSGIRLRSSTVQTLAMALHELATNAVKYGALGQPSGHLAITWRLKPIGEDGRPWLHIDWRETGVAMPPAGSAPGGSRQGRELIEQALPYQLSAKTSYALTPEGVHCTISIPVSASTMEVEPHG